MERQRWYGQQRGGNQEIVNLLLKNSMISFKDQDYQKSEAFLSAICLGHEGIVKLFLQNGIDINKRYFDDFTALMYAAEAGNARIVNLLLQQPGIDIDARNAEGETALDIAKRKGRRSIIKLIQSKMAPQNQQFDLFIEKVKHLSSEKIYEEFIHAVSQGDINEMDSLLEERGADIKNIVNAKNKKGDSSLIIAR